MFELNSIGQVPPQDVKTGQPKRKNKMAESALNSVFNFHVKPFEANTNEQKTSYLNRNSDGTTSYYSDYDGDGYTDTILIEDEQGRQVSLSEFGYNKEKGLKREDKTIFRKDGTVEKEIQINKTKGKEVYRKETEWDAKGEEAVRIAEYDDKGNLLRLYEKTDEYYTNGGMLTLTFGKPE